MGSRGGAVSLLLVVLQDVDVVELPELEEVEVELEELEAVLELEE